MVVEERTVLGVIEHGEARRHGAEPAASAPLHRNPTDPTPVSEGATPVSEGAQTGARTSRVRNFLNSVRNYDYRGLPKRAVTNTAYVARHPIAAMKNNKKKTAAAGLLTAAGLAAYMYGGAALNRASQSWDYLKSRAGYGRVVEQQPSAAQPGAGGQPPSTPVPQYNNIDALEQMIRDTVPIQQSLEANLRGAEQMIRDTVPVQQDLQARLREAEKKAEEHDVKAAVHIHGSNINMYGSFIGNPSGQNSIIVSASPYNVSQTTGKDGATQNVTVPTAPAAQQPGAATGATPAEPAVPGQATPATEVQPPSGDKPAAQTPPRVQYNPKIIDFSKGENNGRWVEHVVVDNYYGARNLTQLVKKVADYNGISPYARLKQGDTVKVQFNHGAKGMEEKILIANNGDTLERLVYKEVRSMVNTDSDASGFKEDRYSIMTRKQALDKDYGTKIFGTFVKTAAEYNKPDTLVVVAVPDGERGDVPNGKLTLTQYFVEVPATPAPSPQAALHSTNLGNIVIMGQPDVQPNAVVQDASDSIAYKKPSNAAQSNNKTTYQPQAAERGRVLTFKKPGKATLDSAVASSFNPINDLDSKFASAYAVQQQLYFARKAA